MTKEELKELRLLAEEVNPGPLGSPFNKFLPLFDYIEKLELALDFHGERMKLMTQNKESL